MGGSSWEVLVGGSSWEVLRGRFFVSLRTHLSVRQSSGALYTTVSDSGFFEF